MSDEPDRNERIRQLAHSIWESEGRPQGQQVRHWHMATRLIQAAERAEGDQDNARESDA